LHTAIRGSRYRQFALLPAREGEYDAGFYALLQASAMDAIVRHTEPGGTFTHYTSEKFGAQSATLELGKVLAFGENDLRLFAGTDATVRALIADAALPARTKRRRTIFWCRRASSRATAILRSTLTRKLTTSPRCLPGMKLPASRIKRGLFRLTRRTSYFRMREWQPGNAPVCC
jgi:hypothetical protein